MTAPIEYLADDDLIVFTCQDCRSAETEARGAACLPAAIASFLRRAGWKQITPGAGPRRLVCANCADLRRREQLARDINLWIKTKRAQQARQNQRLAG